MTNIPVVNLLIGAGMVVIFGEYPDDFALALACEPKPENLHIHHMTEADSNMVNSIDFSNILKG